MTSPAESEIVINVASLAPDETVTITLLLSDFSEALPTIAVKSDSSIGKESTIFGRLLTLPEPNLMDRLSSWIIPFLLLIFMLIVSYRMWKSLARRQLRDTNNTAFLLLHNNLLDEAIKIFEHEIYNRGGDCYYFSNYALCLALKGQYDVANGLINVAKSVSVTSQDKAVTSFNHSLIMLLQGNTLEGLAFFEEAVKLELKEINKYVKTSFVVDQIKANNKEFADKLALHIQ